MHRPPTTPAELSRRQLDVLCEIANGATVDEVAHRMHLSPHTVRHHLRVARQRLCAPNTLAAVVHAIAGGLLDASELPVRPSPASIDRARQHHGASDVIRAAAPPPPRTRRSSSP
ncbi:response regulator transcription factor [Leifsonia williamsii]|uniref:response regulator transcription factor n=1 Tax=Leifsonia williamsii TaxID=3035919 RepID=UPI003432E6D5